jgi:hypothetical protein
VVTDTGAAIGAILELNHQTGSEADDDYNVIRSRTYNDNASPEEIVMAEIRMIAIDVSDGSEDGAVEIWAADTGTLTEVAHFGVSTAGTRVISFFGDTPAAQVTDWGAITDSTTGTAGAALNDVGGSFNQGVLNDNFATVAAFMADVRSFAQAFGMMT